MVNLTGQRLSRLGAWLGVALVVFVFILGGGSRATADEDWSEVHQTVAALLNEVPGLYSAGDVAGVEATLRKAYYEHYQASGLEDQIKHRLGADRSNAFSKGIVELRNRSKQAAPQTEIEERTEQLVTQLATDVDDLRTAPEINDRWTRVAQDIVTAVNNALTLHEQGRSEEALKEASRAYLQHYEADGLEKATLSYISHARVAKVEAEFRDIRVGVRDGAPVEEVRAHVETLSQMVLEDAAKLDSLGASQAVGWSGFVAAFLILIREGVEALLVVAAVVTYVLKTGRRDQLRGVYLGIAAAVAVSIGLAILFSSLTSSADLGMTQELIEGVVGLLAAVLLIHVSSWILSKSEGDAWHRYITNTVDQHSESGSKWALFTVVFLAVAREGFETILFFIPVFGAAQSRTDHLLIWAGMAAAAVVLLVLFLLVRYFGIRLPLRKFFRWTSALLALLAITMVGGAIKEFQDAMILDATPVAGVPQISWLGLYPTVETLVAQGITAVIVISLMIWQLRRSSQAKTRSGIEPDIKNGSEIEMVPETQLIEEQLATQIEEA